MDFLRAASCTLGWVFARHRHMMVRAIPNRDAMTPPQLTADAPILDILQPVVIGLLESFGDDLDAAVLYSFECGFGQRLDGHKPLGGDHRLDDLSTPLAARDGCSIGFGLDHETCLLHISP